jgi:hypothetical protein
MTAHASEIHGSGPEFCIGASESSTANQGRCGLWLRRCSAAVPQPAVLHETSIYNDIVFLPLEAGFSVSTVK